MTERVKVKTMEEGEARKANNGRKSRYLLIQRECSLGVIEDASWNEVFSVCLDHPLSVGGGKQVYVHTRVSPSSLRREYRNLTCQTVRRASFLPLLRQRE